VDGRDDARVCVRQVGRVGELRRRGWGQAQGGRVRDSAGQQVAETIAETIAERHLHDMQSLTDATRVQDLPELCNSSEEGGRWSCTGGSGARGGSGGTCCGSVIGSRVWGGWEKNLALRLLAGAEARSSCSRMPTRPAMS
jgi:hypothetical protein